MKKLQKLQNQLIKDEILIVRPEIGFPEIVKLIELYRIWKKGEKVEILYGLDKYQQLKLQEIVLEDNDLEEKEIMARYWFFNPLTLEPYLSQGWTYDNSEKRWVYSQKLAMDD